MSGFGENTSCSHGTSRNGLTAVCSAWLAALASNGTTCQLDDATRHSPDARRSTTSYTSARGSNVAGIAGGNGSGVYVSMLVPPSRPEHVARAASSSVVEQGQCGPTPGYLCTGGVDPIL